MINDTRRAEELFEALGELDDDVIADAKHISSYGENVVVVKRTPLWKTIAGWSAAAACLAVLAVGGIFGYKYISGRNAVTPPASGTSVGTSIWVSDCHAYSPPEFPEEAKYVYTGDYSELEASGRGIVDRIVYSDLITLEERSDLIVIGEFTDDPHQYIDPNYDIVPSSYVNEHSCNIFKIDKVIKGSCFEGEEILIFQKGYVGKNMFYQLSNLTPMLKGDKWIYFLGKDDDGYYPVGGSDGRYPVPGSEHEFVLNNNVYGVFDTSEFHSNVYEDIKKRLPDWKYEVYFESEYPDGTEVYTGDYSGLEVVVPEFHYGRTKVSYEELFNEEIGCEFVVTGEFIDDTRQSVWSSGNDYYGCSYNKFRVDKVFMGDIEEGQIVMIEQAGFIVDGTYYVSDNMTPMIKGDKWLYCLRKSGGICSAHRCGSGRYPIPGNGNKSLDFTDGYYGVCDTEYANREVYERLLSELGIAVTKDFDGVVFSVIMNGKSFKAGDEIKATATVRNTTDEPIGLIMLGQEENSNTVVFSFVSRSLHGSATLYDKNTLGREFDPSNDSQIIQPGEVYVQEMDYVLPVFDSTPSKFEPGEYKGVAVISLMPYPYGVYNETHDLVVEFFLTLEGETSDDRAIVSKAYDYNGGIEEWTMPEFSDVLFRCDGKTMSARRNYGIPEEPVYTLYTGMPINDVYLVDLNGDGKREIVSTVEYGSGIIDSRVLVFDYENRICYTLCDRGDYNYALYTENGELFVRKSVYPDGETVSQPLTLDMMTEDGGVSRSDINSPLMDYSGLIDLSDEYGEFEFAYMYTTADEEARVYSTVDGEVVEIGNDASDGGWGNYICILGGNGKYYCYSAMYDILGGIAVNVGDRVTAGQEIGKVGISGLQDLENCYGVRYTCSDHMPEIYKAE